MSFPSRDELLNCWWVSGEWLKVVLMSGIIQQIGVCRVGFGRGNEGKLRVFLQGWGDADDAGY